MDTPARWRAYVCCGPTCTLRRSPALIDTLERLVEQAELGSEVEVLPGGCMKHCERGPSLAIWPGPVYYEQVDGGRLKRIVREHLRADCPIHEWFYHEPTPARPINPRARPFRPALAAATPPPSSARPMPGKKTSTPRPARPDPEVDDFKW